MTSNEGSSTDCRIDGLHLGRGEANVRLIYEVLPVLAFANSTACKELAQQIGNLCIGHDYPFVTSVLNEAGIPLDDPFG